MHAEGKESRRMKQNAAAATRLRCQVGIVLEEQAAALLVLFEQLKAQPLYLPNKHVLQRIVADRRHGVAELKSYWRPAVACGRAERRCGVCGWVQQQRDRQRRAKSKAGCLKAGAPGLRPAGAKMEVYVTQFEQIRGAGGMETGSQVVPPSRAPGK